jgi:hypothetical protein
LAPLVIFGASLGLLMVLSGLGCEVGGTVARWSRWVALPFNDFPPTRLLMIVGVVLAQFATGNRLVRLVLASVARYVQLESRSRRIGSRADACWALWSVC